MSDKEMRVVITGDASSLLASTKRVDSSLRQITAAAEEAGKKIGGMESEMTGVSQAASETAQMLQSFLPTDGSFNLKSLEGTMFLEPLTAVLRNFSRDAAGIAKELKGSNGQNISAEQTLSMRQKIGYHGASAGDLLEAVRLYDGVLSKIKDPTQQSEFKREVDSLQRHVSEFVFKTAYQSLGGVVSDDALISAIKAHSPFQKGLQQGFARFKLTESQQDDILRATVLNSGYQFMRQDYLAKARQLGHIPQSALARPQMYSYDYRDRLPEKFRSVSPYADSSVAHQYRSSPGRMLTADEYSQVKSLALRDPMFMLALEKQGLAVRNASALDRRRSPATEYAFLDSYSQLDLAKAVGSYWKMGISKWEGAPMFFKDMRSPEYRTQKSLANKDTKGVESFLEGLEVLAGIDFGNLLYDQSEDMPSQDVVIAQFKRLAKTRGRKIERAAPVTPKITPEQYQILSLTMADYLSGATVPETWKHPTGKYGYEEAGKSGYAMISESPLTRILHMHGHNTFGNGSKTNNDKPVMFQVRVGEERFKRDSAGNLEFSEPDEHGFSFPKINPEYEKFLTEIFGEDLSVPKWQEHFGTQYAPFTVKDGKLFMIRKDAYEAALRISKEKTGANVFNNFADGMLFSSSSELAKVIEARNRILSPGVTIESLSGHLPSSKKIAFIDSKFLTGVLDKDGKTYLPGNDGAGMFMPGYIPGDIIQGRSGGIKGVLQSYNFKQYLRDRFGLKPGESFYVPGLNGIDVMRSRIKKADPTEAELEAALREEWKTYGTTRFTQEELDKYFVDLMQYEGFLDKTHIKTPLFRKKRKDGTAGNWVSNSEAQQIWEGVLASSGGLEAMATGESALSFQDSLAFQSASHLKLKPEQRLANNRAWDAYIAKLQNNATAAEILFGGNTKLDKEIRANPELISSTPMAMQRVLSAIESARLKKAAGEIFGQDNIITALAAIDPISFFDRLAPGNLTPQQIGQMVEGLTDKEAVLPTVWKGTTLFGAGRYPRNIREDLTGKHNQVVADIISQYGGSDHALYLVPELIALMGGGDFDGDEVQLVRGKLHSYFEQTEEYYDKIFEGQTAKVSKVSLGQDKFDTPRAGTGADIAQMDWRQGAGVFQMARVNAINEALSQINFDDPNLRKRYAQAGLDARAMYDIDSVFLKKNELATWSPAAKEALKLGKRTFSLLFRDMQKAVATGDYKSVDFRDYNLASGYSALQMSLMGAFADNPVFSEIFEKVMQAQEELQGINMNGDSFDIARGSVLRFVNRLFGQQLMGRKIGSKSIDQFQSLLRTYSTELSTRQKTAGTDLASEMDRYEREYNGLRAQLAFVREFGTTTENEEAGRGYMSLYGGLLPTTDDVTGFDTGFETEQAAREQRSAEEIAKIFGRNAMVGANRILTSGMQARAARLLAGSTSQLYSENIPTYTRLRQMVEWPDDFQEEVIRGKPPKSSKSVHTDLGTIFDKVASQWAYRRMLAQQEGTPITEEWQKETSDFLLQYLGALLGSESVSFDGLLTETKEGEIVRKESEKISPSQFRGIFGKPEIAEKIKGIEDTVRVLPYMFLNKRILGTQRRINALLGRRANGEEVATRGDIDLLMQDIETGNLEVLDFKTSRDALNEFQVYSKRDFSTGEEDKTSPVQLTGGVQTIDYAAGINRTGYIDPKTKQVVRDNKGNIAKATKVHILGTADAPSQIPVLVRPEEYEGFVRTRQIVDNEGNELDVVKDAAAASQAMMYALEMITAYKRVDAPQDFLIEMHERARKLYKDPSFARGVDETYEAYDARLKKSFTSELLDSALTTTIGRRNGESTESAIQREQPILGAIINMLSGNLSDDQRSVIERHISNSETRKRNVDTLSKRDASSIAQAISLSQDTKDAADRSESLGAKIRARKLSIEAQLEASESGIQVSGPTHIQKLKSELDAFEQVRAQLYGRGADKVNSDEWQRLEDAYRKHSSDYNDLIRTEAPAALDLFLSELSKPIESPALKKIRSETEDLQRAFIEASAAYDALVDKQINHADQFDSADQEALLAAQVKRDEAEKLLDERTLANNRSFSLIDVIEQIETEQTMRHFRQALGLKAMSPKETQENAIQDSLNSMRSRVIAEYEKARTSNPAFMQTLESLFPYLGITFDELQQATFNPNSFYENILRQQQAVQLQHDQQVFNNQSALLQNRNGKYRSPETRAMQSFLSERASVQKMFEDARSRGLDTSALDSVMSAYGLISSTNLDDLTTYEKMLKDGSIDQQTFDMLTAGFIKYNDPNSTYAFHEILNRTVQQDALAQLQREAQIRKMQTSVGLKQDRTGFINTKAQEMRTSFTEAMRSYMGSGGVPNESMIDFGKLLGLRYDKTKSEFVVSMDGKYDQSLLDALGLDYDRVQSGSNANVLQQELRLGLTSGRDAQIKIAKEQRKAALTAYLSKAADAYGTESDQYADALRLYNASITDIESGAFEQRTGDAYDATRKLQRQQDAEMQRRMEYQNAHHRTFTGRPTFFQRVSDTREQMIRSRQDELMSRQAQYNKWDAESKEIEARRVNGAYANTQDAERARELSGYMNAARTGIQQTERDIATLNGPMGTVAATMTQVGNMFSRLGSMFGRRIFYRLLGEVTQFVKQFDASMNEIQMITLKTDDEMVGIRSATLNKAVNMKTSVSNVAQTEAALYRQGLSDSEVSTRTDAIIKFATVSGTKVQDAVKVVTTALQTGLVDSAEKAIDVLVALGDAAATTAGEIGAGIQKAGAAASAAGVSYDELAAMLTITTSKTQLGGKQAGTAFQTLFSRYQKITTSNYVADQNGEVTTWNDFDKALKLVGLSGISDGNGNVKGFVEIMRELSKVWDDLDDAQKSMIANSVAGTRQMNNFYALMEGFTELDENGVSMFDKYFNLAENSEGITTEKYEIAMKSLNASINEVKSSFDSLVQSIVDMPAVKGTLSGIFDITSGFLKTLAGAATKAPTLAALFSIIAVGLSKIATTALLAKASFLVPFGGLISTIATLGALFLGSSIASGIHSAINGPSEEEIAQKKQERIDQRTQSTTRYEGKINEARSQIDALREEYNKLKKIGDKADTTNLVNMVDKLKSMFPSLSDVIADSSLKLDEWESKIQELEGRVGEISRQYLALTYNNTKQNIEDKDASELFGQAAMGYTTYDRYYTDEQWDNLTHIASYKKQGLDPGPYFIKGYAMNKLLPADIAEAGLARNLFGPYIVDEEKFMQWFKKTVGISGGSNDWSELYSYLTQNKNKRPELSDIEVDYQAEAEAQAQQAQEDLETLRRQYPGLTDSDIDTLYNQREQLIQRNAELESLYGADIPLLNVESTKHQNRVLERKNLALQGRLDELLAPYGTFEDLQSLLDAATETVSGGAPTTYAQPQGNLNEANAAKQSSLSTKASNEERIRELEALQKQDQQIIQRYSLYQEGLQKFNNNAGLALGYATSGLSQSEAMSFGSFAIKYANYLSGNGSYQDAFGHEDYGIEIARLQEENAWHDGVIRISDGIIKEWDKYNAHQTQVDAYKAAETTRTELQSVFDEATAIRGEIEANNASITRNGLVIEYNDNRGRIATLPSTPTIEYTDAWKSNNTFESYVASKNAEYEEQQKAYEDYARVALRYFVNNSPEMKSIAAEWASMTGSKFTEQEYLDYMFDYYDKNYITGKPYTNFMGEDGYLDKDKLVGFTFNGTGSRMKTVFEEGTTIDEAIAAAQPEFLYKYAIATVDEDGNIVSPTDESERFTLSEAQERIKTSGQSQRMIMMKDATGAWVSPFLGVEASLETLLQERNSKTTNPEAVFAFANLLANASEGFNLDASGKATMKTGVGENGEPVEIPLDNLIRNMASNSKNASILGGYELYKQHKITPQQWATMIYGENDFVPQSEVAAIFDSALFDEDGKVNNLFSEREWKESGIIEAWEKVYGSDIASFVKQAAKEGRALTEDELRLYKEKSYQTYLKDVYGTGKNYDEASKMANSIIAGGKVATQQYGAMATEVSEYALLTRATEKYKKRLKLTTEEVQAFSKATGYSSTQIQNHTADVEDATSKVEDYQKETRATYETLASMVLSKTGETWDQIYDKNGNVNKGLGKEAGTFFTTMKRMGITFSNEGVANFSGAQVDEQTFSQYVKEQKRDSGALRRQRGLFLQALGMNGNNLDQAIASLNGSDWQALTNGDQNLMTLINAEATGEEIRDYLIRSYTGQNGAFDQRYATTNRQLFGGELPKTMTAQSMQSAKDIWLKMEDPQRVLAQQMFGEMGAAGSRLMEFLNGNVAITDENVAEYNNLKAQFDAQQAALGHRNAEQIASVMAGGKSSNLLDQYSVLNQYNQQARNIGVAQFAYNRILAGNGQGADYSAIASLLQMDENTLRSEMKTTAGQEKIQSLISAKTEEMGNIIYQGLAGMLGVKLEGDYSSYKSQIEAAAKDADTNVQNFVNSLLGILGIASQATSGLLTSQQAYEQSLAEYKSQNNANTISGLYYNAFKNPGDKKFSEIMSDVSGQIEDNKLDATNYWAQHQDLMLFGSLVDQGLMSPETYADYFDASRKGITKDWAYFAPAMSAIGATSEPGGDNVFDASGHIVSQKAFSTWYDKNAENPIAMGIFNEYAETMGASSFWNDIIRNGENAANAVEAFNNQISSKQAENANKYNTQLSKANEWFTKLQNGGAGAAQVLQDVMSTMVSLKDKRASLNAMRGTPKDDDVSTFNQLFGTSFTKDSWMKLDAGSKKILLQNAEIVLDSETLTFQQDFENGVLRSLNEKIQAALQRGDITEAQINLAIEGEADATSVINSITDQEWAIAQAMLKAAGWSLKLKGGEGDTVAELYVDFKNLLGGGVPTGKGGGGGGGGGKSAVDKFLEKLKHELETLDHEMKMLQTKSSSLKDAGFLTLYGKSLEDMNSVLNRRIKLLKEQREKIIAEMAKVKEGSDDWYKLRSQLYSTDEALEEATADIDKNTKALRENQIAIEQTTASVQDEILKRLQEEDNEKREKLAGAVELESQILNAIRARYQKEWELIKEDVNKKKEALQEEMNLIDKRLQARKDAEKEADDYAELSELKRQYGLISMDSSRSKEANELREKITDKEKTLGWSIADAQAEAQKTVLSDQMTAYDQYLTEGEKQMNAWLADANNFSQEVSTVMGKSQEELLTWLKNNVDEFANSLQNTQDQMVQSWSDTWKKMMNITMSYKTEEETIKAIMASKETFISFMSKSSEFQNASPEKQKIMIAAWEDMYDSMTNAHAESKEETSEPQEEEKEETKKPWQLTPEERKRLEDEAKKKSEEETEKRRKKKDEDKKTEGPKLKEERISKPIEEDEDKKYDFKKKNPDGSGSDDKDDDKKRLGNPMMRAASGGLINYTGPAWLDGTFANPERVLSPRQTELFDSLVSSLESNELIDVLNSYQNTMTRMGYAGVNPYITNVDSDGGSSSIGDVYVTINEATLKTDADYEEVAERVGEHFARALERQGLHTTNFSF